MPWYRRRYRPGATYFFTVNLAERGADHLTTQIADLRSCYARCAREHPFHTDAIVILPDHLHAVWTLPEGEADFSGRWMRIKAGFTRAMAARGLSPTLRRSASKARKREHGLWQRRFWERCIRDEAEYLAALRYVWGNPVRHGYVARAVDWPFSSVHREIRAGRLPEGGI